MLRYVLLVLLVFSVFFLIGYLFLSNKQLSQQVKNLSSQKATVTSNQTVPQFTPRTPKAITSEPETSINRSQVESGNIVYEKYAPGTNLDLVRSGDINKLAEALERYGADHGEVPASLDQLVNKYITVLPRDPVTGKLYEYKKTGTASYTITYTQDNGLTLTFVRTPK